MMKKNLLTIFVILAVTLVCVAAFGEEGGAEAHEEGGIPQMVLWQALNFFALIALLAFILKGKLGGFFKQRHDAVADAIKEANRIKTEAQEKHQEYVIKIQQLQREQENILEQIRKDGEESKRRMVAEAERLAENIRAEAKRAAEAESEKARTELYEDVLNQALEGARAILVKSVAENDQRRLQKEFVEKIEAVQ